ncbi:protein IG [Testudinid alphaherpesvirus 3]|uniref:Protein IG n=1 Tax=Testudinid alphaherpesvirus 3 TaxID=2560801 RepID=A0A0K1R197_9ALPH|nr:protein IG [Testudinid alphaherpesvirus 3]AIU39336.1 protein IG [Testudinid alphaherpesvirus 3]AIU39431.1 protein IG [Testudinid alphaherpesvirus 3]AKI81706.1 protein IG [Testudinid alphaherpesvirus 3]AKI81807.1 protein IG [Testudinid alphaherpesvirus 3]AKV40717.1 hypothetical protein [Testudinid alphaherpesvirus 3]
MPSSTRTHTMPMPDLGPSFSRGIAGMSFKITCDDMVYVGFSRLRFKSRGYTAMGDGKFQCSKCGIVYIGEMYMKHHVQMHEGCYRLQCLFCDQGFAQLHILRRHMGTCPEITQSKVDTLTDRLIRTHTLSEDEAKNVRAALLAHRKTTRRPRKVVKKALPRIIPNKPIETIEPQFDHETEVALAVSVLQEIIKTMDNESDQ